MNCKRFCCCLGLIALIGIQPVIAWAADLGERIYQSGIGRDGREIMATLPGQVSLQGQAVACAGCHGADAQGGGESFVQAPAIRWQALVKRASANYSLKDFRQALTQGLATDGRSLDPIMPRFDLATDELEALATYLRQLGAESSQSIAVALSLLPEPGISPLADAIAGKIERCDELAPGTRLWPLEILRFKNPEHAMQQLSQRLAQGKVRFLVAPFLAGWETAYLAFLNDHNLPTLLPISTQEFASSAQIFLAFPGMSAQIRALIDAALQRHIKQLTALIAADDAQGQVLFEQAQRYAASIGLKLQLAKNDSESGKKTANWLVLSPLNRLQDMLPLLQNKGSSVWVAAQFFNPALANKASSWFIAYPYQPGSADGPGWQKPVNRWSLATCSILALAAENPDSEWWNDDSASRLSELIPHSAVVLPW